MRNIVYTYALGILQSYSPTACDRYIKYFFSCDLKFRYEPLSVNVLYNPHGADVTGSGY